MFFFILEYPNDSGYYGSGDSDAANCFDDEVCYKQGSGSGEDNDEDDSEGSGNHYDDTHDSGSPDPAKPPWVTGRAPIEYKDISVEEEKTTRSPPPFTGGSLSLHPSYYMILLYYALPVIIVQIGRLV